MVQHCRCWRSRSTLFRNACVGILAAPPRRVSSVITARFRHAGCRLARAVPSNKACNGRNRQVCLLGRRPCRRRHVTKGVSDIAIPACRGSPGPVRGRSSCPLPPQIHAHHSYTHIITCLTAYYSIRPSTRWLHSSDALSDVHPTSQLRRPRSSDVHLTSLLQRPLQGFDSRSMHQCRQRLEARGMTSLAWRRRRHHDHHGRYRADRHSSELNAYPASHPSHAPS